MADKILIIANPKSGNNRGLQHAELARALLTQNGISVAVRYTKARGDAEVIAFKAVEEGYSCVVACGGDGTVNEVVNGIVGTDVSLGILPSGRGNDFARSVNIPFSPQKAAMVLLKGHKVICDLGKVNNRYFATVVTLGFDSEVAKFVYQGSGPFNGVLAYLWGVIRTLRRYKGIDLRISGEFGVAVQKVLLVATGNTSTYGGGIKIVPNADPTDGKLDICIVRMMSIGQILKLLPSVYRGAHLNHPSILSYRACKIRLETEGPMALFADGEPVGETPVEIISSSGIIPVICPNK